MSNEIKISELTEATEVNNEDLIMIVQNGVNKKVPAKKIRTGGGTGDNKNMLQLVFPIGSTYVTQTADENPNTILGFGTWERLKGKICLGLDEDDADFNAIGKTGGAKEHLITFDELPEYTMFNNAYDGNGGYMNIPNGGRSGWQKGSNQNTISIVQPYEIVGYMWIRRA